ncbi:MAG: hypothetical protein ABL908_18645 [Hyphomicrobium sp.]
MHNRSGNVIAEADGTTGVVAKEYIWLSGAGYVGTDPGSGSGASLRQAGPSAAAVASPVPRPSCSTSTPIT